MNRIYLAGPDVFLPDAVEAGNRKKELCTKYGFEGVYPFDAEIDFSKYEEKRNVGFAISKINENLIRSCQYVIANLTPFRGPSADVGTVYEVGFARALGLTIYGYSNVGSDYKGRINSTSNYDNYGMTIEDFNLKDNLMIEGGIQLSGGIFICSDEVEYNKKFTDLTKFEHCLQLIKTSA